MDIAGWGPLNTVLINLTGFLITQFTNIIERLIKRLLTHTHILHKDAGNNHLNGLPGGIGFLVRLTELLLPNNHIKELPPDIVNMRCKLAYLT